MVPDNPWLGSGSSLLSLEGLGLEYRNGDWLVFGLLIAGRWNANTPGPFGEVLGRIFDPIFGCSTAGGVHDCSLLIGVRGVFCGLEEACTSLG